MAFVDLNDMVVSQVRQAADIVDFVSQYTQLRPAGRSHKGVCPFHREKTPSFHVDRAKGLFYCFGCGAGGDLFKFLMMHERYTFPEAVEHVANRVGIELPKKKRGRDEEGKEDLYEIVEEAAEAFHQALGWTPNRADEYLRNRGVDPAIWPKYGFGYAPDSWDYLLSRLGRKFAPRKLELAGLALPRKSGEGFYDRFRNRMMVTIHSDNGAVIGFGGRSLDGSDPKYLNSPESAIFNKSQLLYNLHRAKDHIRKLERAILVEGYFDCITLDHAGVPGVVASMGTSLTPGQASLLRRFAKRVVVAYDGDEAGRNATLRAAPILLAAGLQVEVIDVGPGADPDTYLREKGLEGLMELLGTAADVFTFALSRLAAQPSSMTGAERSATIDQLGPLLSSVADPVVRNDAAHRIADHMRLEFETVWSRVKNGKSTASPLTAPAGRDSNVLGGDDLVLAAVLNGAIPFSEISDLRPSAFSDASSRSLFSLFLSTPEAIKSGSLEALQSGIKGEAEITRFAKLHLIDPGDLLTPEKLRPALNQLRRKSLEDELAALREAEPGLGGEEARENNARQQELVKKIHGVRREAP